MYVLITFLVTDTSFLGSDLIQMTIKVIIASIIFILAIYSFITIAGSPFKEKSWYWNAGFA